MKNIFVLFIIIVTSTYNSFCQLNIIDSNCDKLWYITSGAFCNNPVDTCLMKTDIFKLGGTIMENEIVYTSVLKSSDSILISWDTIGYIREVNRKVFYKPYSKIYEFLLYDFGLELSSDIYMYNRLYGIDSLKFTVTKIDTILIGNEKRKRMFLSGDQNEIWIEGLGSLKGLIFSGMFVSGGFTEVSCFSENGNIVYKNPKYENCFCTRNETAKIDLTNEPILYPNPSKGFVIIRDMINAKFQLYDLSGFRIIDRNINTHNFNIDVSKLKSGIYIYNINYLDTNIVGRLILKDK